MNGRGSALPFCFSAKTARISATLQHETWLVRTQVIASALNMCGLYQRIA